MDDQVARLVVERKVAGNECFDYFFPLWVDVIINLQRGCLGVIADPGSYEATNACHIKHTILLGIEKV